MISVHKEHATRRKLKLGQSDVFLQKAPISFDASVQEMFNSFACGGLLLLAAPGGEKDTQYLARLCKEQRVTCASFVPSQLDVLLQARPAPHRLLLSACCCRYDCANAQNSAVQEPETSACTALRHVLVGGEALPPALAARFEQRLPKAHLHNAYGPTETTVDATGAALHLPVDISVRKHTQGYRRSSRGVVSVRCGPIEVSVPEPYVCSPGYDVTAEFKGGATVPIGQPIANMRCYVLDAQLQLVPVGVPGELMVSGIQLARGYLKRPDLTAEKFVPNLYAGGEPHHDRLYRTGA